MELFIQTDICYPGPGYTRLLEYDEEGRLVKIKRNTGGTITTVYEYGYGYDGGRRWRKDYLQNQWTWYPCGVACSAGELVEQQSDLTGATWTTVGQYLKAGAECSDILLTRNSENHHQDIHGYSQLITDANIATVSNIVYDAFDVAMFTSGVALSQWRLGDHYTSEEGAVANCWIKPDRDLDFFQYCGGQPPKGVPLPPQLPKPKKRRKRPSIQDGPCGKIEDGICYRIKVQEQKCKAYKCTRRYGCTGVDCPTEKQLSSDEGT